MIWNLMDEQSRMRSDYALALGNYKIGFEMSCKDERLAAIVYEDQGDAYLQLLRVPRYGHPRMLCFRGGKFYYDDDLSLVLQDFESHRDQIQLDAENNAEFVVEDVGDKDYIGLLENLAELTDEVQPYHLNVLRRIVEIYHDSDDGTMNVEDLRILYY